MDADTPREVQAGSAWVLWVMSSIVVLLLGTSLMMCYVVHAFHLFIQKALPDLSRLPWYMHISIVAAPNLWVGMLVIAAGSIYIFRRQDRAGSLLPWLVGSSLTYVVLCAVMVYFVADSMVQSGVSR